MLSTSDIRQGRILIVDDKPANVLLLQGMLHRAGYVSLTSTMDPHAVSELHRNNRYDLWGDVVNTASRMESHGVAGRIQVTDATRRRLSERFLFEERGKIAVKGKGEMRTWFVKGRNGSAEFDAAPLN
ncbi:MAG: hypothetical protein IH606_00405 [Burkholderiales bacterium]|nr:hypothetical protein [Burkholderiales bacterium]